MMTPSRPSSRLVRFGVFELDLQTGELRKKGVKIALQEQPFQVLAALVARPGELVTREELRQQLWPEAVFVDFDHGLNKAVGKIRRVLGDLPESPRFVETLERRGYRFIAPVERVTWHSPASPAADAAPLIVRLVWNDRAIPLAAGTHLIGRDSSCQVWIDSSVVSRRHAKIAIDAGGANIEDLGSHNGTFVNGDRVTCARPLVDRDEIHVGPARLTVHIDRNAATLTDPASR